jgi:RNA polymerase sigma-70 factor (ECF subfamily)
MSGAALDRVFRESSGRIVAALAARYRDLDLAEDGFSEACVRALRDWREGRVPEDPSAWLYRAASRVVIDSLRRQRVRDALVHVDADHLVEQSIEEALGEDRSLIPDERLRLIFICCHPAVTMDSRAALTLKLVCGLTTIEIARAFLLPESTLAQRLVRAKHKISEAGVPFELPAPEHWSERLESVLTALEVAYSKAHEDAGFVFRARKAWLSRHDGPRFRVMSVQSCWQDDVTIFRERCSGQACSAGPLMGAAFLPLFDSAALSLRMEGPSMCR